jgi:peptidoglycan/xylan/chitin deacetylase (PgdA/CDA1 family)
MAKEIWKESPFGENSIFHASWEEKQKNERLKKQQSLENSTSNSGKIYLTFDDGLQLGTKDVLDVLKANNVKATFFLTGIHVKNFIEKVNKDEGLKMLRDIYENHLIGNHSYSHANDFFENYYKNGLKIGTRPNGDYIFRTVLADFQMNDQTINKFLNDAGIKITGNFQHKRARFPGRNTWKTDTINDVETDTKEEAEDLFKAGYKLYGWDTEWNMNFQIVNISKSNIQSRVDENKMNWENEEQSHPFFDLCNSNLVDKDRVNETWLAVSNDLEDYANHSSLQPFDDKSKISKKAILLMHERAFRQCGNKYKTEASKLSSLIISLKKKGFTFDTMDNY